MKLQAILGLIITSLVTQIAQSATAKLPSLAIEGQGQKLNTPLILKFSNLPLFNTGEIVIQPKALRDVNRESSTENLAFDITTKLAINTPEYKIPIIIEKNGEYELEISITTTKQDKTSNISTKLFVLAEQGKTTIGRSILDAAIISITGKSQTNWKIEKYKEVAVPNELEKWIASREERLIKAIQEKVPIAIIE